MQDWSRRHVMGLLTAAAPFAVSGCGKGDDDSSTSATPSAPAVTATPTSIRGLGVTSHVIFYGQSLPYGYASTPLFSDQPLPYALTFDGGVRTSQDDNRTSLIPLRETVSANGGETPASGFAKMFAQLCRDRIGIDLAALGAEAPQKLLFSDPASGGAEIAALKSGTAPFDAIGEDLAAAKVLSAAPYRVAALIWWQGQSDQGKATPQAQYEADVRRLRADAESLAKSTSMVDALLPMIVVQIGTLGGATVDGSTRPEIALAHLNLVRAGAAIGGSFAEHWLDHRPDDIHYPAQSEYIAGAYLCLDMWNWIVEGRRPTPIAPARDAKGKSLARRAGQTATIPFTVASGTPLVIDRMRFPGLRFGGIEARDAAGAAIEVIDARVNGHDLIVTVAGRLGAGARIIGGWNGAGLAHQLGLRDSLGDTLIFDPAGIKHPMHKPAWIFEETLS